jgi:hypothetical protein
VGGLPAPEQLLDSGAGSDQLDPWHRDRLLGKPERFHQGRVTAIEIAGGRQGAGPTEQQRGPVFGRGGLGEDAQRRLEPARGARRSAFRGRLARLA